MLPCAQDAGTYGETLPPKGGRRARRCLPVRPSGVERRERVPLDSSVRQPCVRQPVRQAALFPRTEHPRHDSPSGCCSPS